MTGLEALGHAHRSEAREAMSPHAMSEPSSLAPNLARMSAVVATLAAFIIVGIALGKAMRAALPMFFSLLSVAMLTLLLISLPTLKHRLQLTNLALLRVNSYRSAIANAVIAIIFATTLSCSLFFTMQSVGVYGNVVAAGVFPFALTHILFALAFVIAPQVVREFNAIRSSREATRAAERLRVANLEHSLAMSELKTLQAQIEPHFLYNVLANVQSMIAQAPATADAMLTYLIDYLKHALPSMRAGESTLRAELDLARSYLAIARLRFGDRLSVTVYENLREDAEAFAMPPMLLLPLVENAIKHGVEGKPGAVSVAIDVEISEEALTIRVSDDGPGFTQTSGSGIGIANVHERLVALYQDRASVHVTLREGGGVVSTLSIPVKERSTA